MRMMIAVVGLTLGFTALAQQRPAAAERTTVMDLEGDVIEGTSDRPDVEPITAQPRAEHGSLIRVRQDFRAQALQSADRI